MRKTSETLPKRLRGTVQRQMVRCGRQWCRCMRGGKRHETFYLFWRGEDGRLRKRYLRRDQVDEARPAVLTRLQEHYELKAGLAEWRALRAQHSEIKLDGTK